MIKNHRTRQILSCSLFALSADLLLPFVREVIKHMQSAMFVRLSHYFLFPRSISFIYRSHLKEWFLKDACCPYSVCAFITFAWKAKRFAFAGFLHLLLLLLLHGFSGYRRIRNRKTFYRISSSHTVQLFVAIRGKFSGAFFFWTGRSKAKFPRDYFIKVATILFAYH